MFIYLTHIYKWKTLSLGGLIHISNYFCWHFCLQNSQSIKIRGHLLLCMMEDIISKQGNGVCPACSLFLILTWVLLLPQCHFINLIKCLIYEWGGGGGAISHPIVSPSPTIFLPPPVSHLPPPCLPAHIPHLPAPVKSVLAVHPSWNP